MLNRLDREDDQLLVKSGKYKSWVGKVLSQGICSPRAPCVVGIVGRVRTVGLVPYRIAPGSLLQENSMRLFSDASEEIPSHQLENFISFL